MVVIRAEARARLRALAAAAYPDEGCGVLIGADGPGPGRTEVAEVTSGRNLREDRARDRYELDPLAILGAERAARSRGLDVVGFWHSHPDHPAEPSGFDSERAWADYVYVIVRTTTGGADGERAWRIAGDGGPFAELALDLAEA